LTRVPRERYLGNNSGALYMTKSATPNPSIEAQTRPAEWQRQFIASALEAEHEVARYGIVHDGDEVLRYLRARLTGQAARRPRHVANG
jgi:hypothetical protein